MAKGSEVEVGAQNGATQRNDATMQRCNNDATERRRRRREGNVDFGRRRTLCLFVIIIMSAYVTRKSINRRIQSNPIEEAQDGKSISPYDSNVVML